MIPSDYNTLLETLTSQQNKVEAPIPATDAAVKGVFQAAKPAEKRTLDPETPVELTQQQKKQKVEAERQAIAKKIESCIKKKIPLKKFQKICEKYGIDALTKKSLLFQVDFYNLILTRVAKLHKVDELTYLEFYKI